jgi:adenylate cyclase
MRSTRAVPYGYDYFGSQPAQDEIFTVQDQVVRTIVATIAGRLQAARVDQSLRKPPASLAAYDCVLRANALPVSDREAQIEARRLSERAIEIDPNYGRAYTQLAISNYLEWANLRLERFQ